MRGFLYEAGHCKASDAIDSHIQSYPHTFTCIHSSLVYTFMQSDLYNGQHYYDCCGLEEEVEVEDDEEEEEDFPNGRKKEQSVGCSIVISFPL